MALKDLLKMSLILALPRYTTVVESRSINNRVHHSPSAPTEIDCEDLPGHRPFPIYNSKYKLLANGSLCCPLNVYDEDGKPRCISESRVRVECAAKGRGIDKDPCLQCDTCAKQIGESCYGPHGIYGSCDKAKGLVCIGIEKDENRIGVCTTDGGPALRSVGEECGGRFDSLGICRSGLVCQEVQEGKNWVCIMNGKLKVVYLTPFL